MAITTAQKLSIYNGALRRLGSRKLASLTENREPRRVMDDVWGSSDEIVTYALERGDWNFAIRSSALSYSVTVTPAFGFARAFDKPTDFVRLNSLSSEPLFSRPLTHQEYVNEATYWFANHDTLYVRYVSNDDAYGKNGDAWTEAFKDFLETHIAFLACDRLTNSASLRREIERARMISLREARSGDAMEEGSKQLPAGSWVRARANGLSTGDGWS